MSRQLKDFECEECGHTQERLTEHSVSTCGKCGGKSKQKQSWLTNRPIFKTGGFYDTDYKEN